MVIVEPTGERAETAEPEQLLQEAWRMLLLARGDGHRQPYARLFGNGVLVRDRVTRTDLATRFKQLGRCWCGRGALRGQPGAGWCCAQHEALWERMTKEQRARVIVARFIAIYGERKPMADDERTRKVARVLADQEVPRQARTVANLAGVPLTRTRAILERLEAQGRARRDRGSWVAVR